MLSIALLVYYNINKNKKNYTAEYFGIETVVSSIDYDSDGVDDYTDILNSAKEQAENKPTYKSEYYESGYPPDDIGVCTDVIWRALKAAGYNLKDLVDEDIKNNPNEYPNITIIDSNIDFRRVVNLNTYFKRHTLTYTLNTNQIAEWQPGDIVVFEDNLHIGIVLDKRNKKGVPYVIHQINTISNFIDGMEEDILEKRTVTGHYRFYLTN